MHSLKLKISVNVFPHCFKNKEWLVGRFSPFLEFLRIVSCSKIFNPNGFIKTDMYELK